MPFTLCKSFCSGRKAQAQKEKAREEAKATGNKRSRRKKVEYYDEVANGAFGPKKKDYNPQVEVPMLDQLEIVGADGQLEMAVTDEGEQGTQANESARLQDEPKTGYTVPTTLEQPEPTKDTPPVPSLFLFCSAQRLLHLSSRFQNHRLSERGLTLFP